MDYTLPVGSTSVRIPVFIQNSAAGDGSGLTGLTNATSGLSCYYWRGDAGNTGGTLVSLASATLGTFTSSGFVEKDATNMPGEYEFGIPNAALAAGATFVIIMFLGNTIGVVNRLITIQLVPLPAFAKNTAISKFTFPMFDGSGNPVTGLSVDCQRSIDGAAFANCTNTPATQISGGWYYIDLTASDLNGTTIALKFTNAGAKDTDYTIVTQSITP